MSESLLSADRNTHLKIAAVALVAARGNTDGPVVKAGTPVTYSDAERSTKQ